jgi:NADH dehydrogenase
MRPLTVDQIRMLQIPHVVSAAALKEGRTLAALGVAHPSSMETIVPEYLEPFRPHGQFASYRG